MRKNTNFDMKDIQKFLCEEKIFAINYGPCETIKKASFTIDFKHHHNHCNNSCFCSITLENILLLVIIIISIAYCYNNTLTLTPYCEYYI